MNVIENKGSEETDFELSGSSSGEELEVQDPYATQPVDINQASPDLQDPDETIQAPPDRRDTVSPVIMQREAGGNSMPQDMSGNEIVRVQFDALAKSNRRPPSFLKFKSHEVGREMKDPKGKTIRECINKIERLIIATHGSQAEKVAAVTKVVAIAVELADAEQKAKATERRKELARERKKLKAEQARLALEHKSEDQQALMNKH